MQVPPPPDVAADPARLAQYEKQEAETNANADGMGDIYEARGCNQQSLYSCRIRTNKTFGVSCTSVHYIDGVSRW